MPSGRTLAQLDAAIDEHMRTQTALSLIIFLPTLKTCSAIAEAKRATTRINHRMVCSAVLPSKVAR
jgi:hypothetical protein